MDDAECGGESSLRDRPPMRGVQERRVRTKTRGESRTTTLAKGTQAKGGSQMLGNCPQRFNDCPGKLRASTRAAADFSAGQAGATGMIAVTCRVRRRS